MIIAVTFRQSVPHKRGNTLDPVFCHQYAAKDCTATPHHISIHQLVSLKPVFSVSLLFWKKPLISPPSFVLSCTISYLPSIFCLAEDLSWLSCVATPLGSAIFLVCCRRWLKGMSHRVTHLPKINLKTPTTVLTQITSFNGFHSRWLLIYHEA